MQNVRKNSLIINTILETQSQFNIIFIQEPPWSEIHKILSLANCENKALRKTTHHPNWLLFARTSSNRSDSPRAIAYINIHLSSLCFSLCNEIINYRDILLISFLNDHVCYYIMNVYSNSSYTALKYLKDTEVNINNILVMTGDFNIRDSLWDTYFPHHSFISDNLIIIADSFNIALSTPTNLCHTRYSDTVGEANSVIDLMFLWYRSSELDWHLIHPDSHFSSNHASLTITIPIADEIVFVKEVISIFKNLDTSNLIDKDNLEHTVNQLEALIKQAWIKNTKKLRIMKHSKQWWMEEYGQSLNNYRMTRSLENWKKFKKVVKDTKRSFFNTRIQEIANKSCGPWKLMNWTNKCKLPAIEAIKYDGQPCLSSDSL